MWWWKRKEAGRRYATGFENLEEGVTGQGMHVASRCWKMQESGLTPEASEGYAALYHLDFRLLTSAFVLF